MRWDGGRVLRAGRPFKECSHIHRCTDSHADKKQEVRIGGEGTSYVVALALQELSRHFVHEGKLTHFSFAQSVDGKKKEVAKYHEKCVTSGAKTPGKGGRGGRKPKASSKVLGAKRAAPARLSEMSKEWLQLYNKIFEELGKKKSSPSFVRTSSKTMHDPAAICTWVEPATVRNLP